MRRQGRSRRAAGLLLVLALLWTLLGAPLTGAEWARYPSKIAAELAAASILYGSSSHIVVRRGARAHRRRKRS